MNFSENNKNFRSMPSKLELERRMKLDYEDPEKLVITPLFTPKQIEEGSIDLRLGTEFVIAKRSKFSVLDGLDEKKTLDSKIVEYQEKIHVKVGDFLVLHPNQFVLGSTFEYVKLPIDHIAYVLGRSSWGRLGLIIATATVVHSGYTGIITLELTNIGDTPIALYPGIRIAQLVFHEISMTKEQKLQRMEALLKDKSKYHASVSPSFSKIHLDEDWEMIRGIRDFRKKNSI